MIQQEDLGFKQDLDSDIKLSIMIYLLHFYVLYKLKPIKKTQVSNRILTMISQTTQFHPRVSLNISVVDMQSLSHEENIGLLYQENWYAYIMHRKLCTYKSEITYVERVLKGKGKNECCERTPLFVVVMQGPITSFTRQKKMDQLD